MKRILRPMFGLIFAALLIGAAALAEPGVMAKTEHHTNYWGDPFYTVPGGELKLEEVRGIRFEATLENVPIYDWDAWWDASEDRDGSVLAWIDDAGIVTFAAEGGVIAPTDSFGLFSGYDNVETIDLNGALDFSRAEDISELFSVCPALKSVDLTGFSAPKAQDMRLFFYSCYTLETVNLEALDTSNVTNMEAMFCHCKSLTQLGASTLNTAAVTNMGHMFFDCPKLASLDISGFDTANVTDMYEMFMGCNSLTDVKLGEGFVIGEDCRTTDMLEGCAFTAWPDGFPVAVAPRQMSADHDRNDVPWLGIDRAAVEAIEFLATTDGAPADAADVSAAQDGSVLAWFAEGTLTYAAEGGVIAPANMDFFFTRYTNAASISLNGALDTSGTTSMWGAFMDCANLKKLDLSGMDTSNVRNMGNMFDGCKSLERLDLSGFDTSNVESMSNMFYGCESLKTLDLSAWRTPNLTDMMAMFSMCTALWDLNMSNFDTSNVTNMAHLYYGCAELQVPYRGDHFTISEDCYTYGMYADSGIEKFIQAALRGTQS